MSAFIKRQPARVVDLGTRPGLNGQVLISTGVAGLDKLLGGGLPLGSLLLVLEDSHSQQHLNLLKCFLAEGVCCKHSLALVTGQQLDLQAVADFLPSLAKSSSSSAGQAASSSSVPSSSATPAGAAAAGTGAAGAPDDGLKIAWQYRKYIQNQQRADSSTAQQPQRSSKAGSSTGSAAAGAAALAAGVGREWCHQFDLTKSLTADAVRAAKLQLACCCTQQQQGASAVAAAAEAAAGFLSNHQPKGPIPVPSRDPASIGRLVLQSLGSPEWWPASSSCNSSSWQCLEGAMLAAVAKLRLAVQDTTCTAVVTCPTSLYSESFQVHLQHLADVVLCVQSLADDSDVYRLLPDPTSAAALLEVRRVPELGLLRQRYSEDRLFLIRMKRRSIAIGPLDLVPLEAAGDAAAEQSAENHKPTAAKLCGSGPGGASAHEF